MVSNVFLKVTKNAGYFTSLSPGAGPNWPGGHPGSIGPLVPHLISHAATRTTSFSCYGLRTYATGPAFSPCCCCCCCWGMYLDVRTCWKWRRCSFLLQETGDGIQQRLPIGEVAP